MMSAHEPGHVGCGLALSSRGWSPIVRRLPCENRTPPVRLPHNGRVRSLREVLHMSDFQAVVRVCMALIITPCAIQAGRFYFTTHHKGR